MISTVLISGNNKDRNNRISHTIIDTITPTPTDILEVTTNGKQMYDGSQVAKVTGSENIDPLNLTQLGIFISGWLSSNPGGLVILNDIMTLEMYHSKESLFRFFHLLCRRSKSAESHLVCIQTNSDTANPFPQLFDFTVYTKTDENKFRIASTIPEDPPFRVKQLKR